MPRYMITICYDGGAYHGFQRQDKFASVQGELEKALAQRLSQTIDLQGSGRTDAGVHAIAQTAHFDCDKEINCEKFPYAMSSLLPKDIAITKCERVADDFHARFCAKRKTYVYRIYYSQIHCPLREKYFHISFYKLDAEKMKEACKYFVGTHDFRSFMLADTKKDNTIRTIYDMKIIVNEDGKQIDIEVTGSGFLHNMVRAIAGTLIDIGRGRLNVEDTPKIIESKKHSMAGKTLPACGLYLKSVEY